MSIQYHPGRANIVADTLSQKAISSLALLRIQESQLIQEFDNLRVTTEVDSKGTLLAHIRVQLDLQEKIRQAQVEDEKIKC